MRVLLVGVVMGLICAGCAGPQVKVMRYTDEVFPPSEQVDVLRTTIPDREYVEIADVSVRINADTRETAVTLLREACARLGADALLLMGERPAGAVAIPVGEMVFAKPVNEMYGIAIKYKQ